jgi:hypothetical protein
MAYPDNPEVASSYSFQIYGHKALLSKENNFELFVYGLKARVIVYFKKKGKLCPNVAFVFCIFVNNSINSFKSNDISSNNNH